LGEFLVESLVSKDDSKLEEGGDVVSGMELGKGQRPFPRCAPQ
jgi:hypothetical protein